MRSGSVYSASFTTFPILQQARRQSTFHHWKIVLGLSVLCHALYDMSRHLRADFGLFAHDSESNLIADIPVTQSYA